MCECGGLLREGGQGDSRRTRAKVIRVSLDELMYGERVTAGRLRRLRLNESILDHKQTAQGHLIYIYIMIMLLSIQLPLICDP